MRKVTPDRQKSKSLRKMAEQTIARVRDTDAETYPSLVLKDYYEVLYFFMESLAYSSGRKTSGAGAHAELTDWICLTFTLPDSMKSFLHLLRKYRNRIAYEGLTIEYSFIKRNQDKLNHAIRTFEGLLDGVDER